MRSITFLPLLFLLLSLSAQGSFETYDFSTTHNEMRYFKLSKELRCPTCQNQNISDSDAPLAADLRRELHRMIEDGYDDEAILDFMVSRFGDFVHYKPRVTPETYVLWYGPFVLLLGGFLAVLFIARNRRLRASSLHTEVAEQDDLPDESETQKSLTLAERERLNRLLQQDKSL